MGFKTVPTFIHEAKRRNKTLKNPFIPKLSLERRSNVSLQYKESAPNKTERDIPGRIHQLENLSTERSVGRAKISSFHMNITSSSSYYKPKSKGFHDLSNKSLNSNSIGRTTLYSNLNAKKNHKSIESFRDKFEEILGKIVEWKNESEKK